VAAGHGLTLANVGAVAALAEVVELNIGHAVVSDALFLGLRGAVEAYRAAIARPTRPLAAD
jgi:pyridoxine 5-phosphate synthase